MGYLQAIVALVPYLKMLVDWIVVTPEEKREEYLRLLPAKLKEISDNEKRASDEKDPSIINRQLNDR